MLDWYVHINKNHHGHHASFALNVTANPRLNHRANLAWNLNESWGVSLTVHWGHWQTDHQNGEHDSCARHQNARWVFPWVIRQTIHWMIRALKTLKPSCFEDVCWRLIRHCRKLNL